MTPYINPAFRERQKPVALLPGADEDPAPAIEALYRDVAPAKPARDRGHLVLCAVLSIPVAVAIGAAFAGDMRLCVIACLMGMAIALIGLYALDGPA